MVVHRIRLSTVIAMPSELWYQLQWA